MVRFIFQFFAKFPLWALHALGALLGLTVYMLAPAYRRKMHEHAAILFPDSPAHRRQVVRANALHSGMALMELPFLWGRPTEQGIGKVMTLEGWDYVEQARGRGEGVLFLTPHLGSFEAAAQVVSTRAPITVLYRPNRNADVQAIIEDSRARNNVALAPTNLKGVRLLLKALKRSELVGLLPDQVPGNGEGVWAPMFGKPAYTMTLPGALKKATGCRIVLAVGVRKPFSGIKLILTEGPESLSEDPVEAATQINAAMERLIRQYPEQYYWGYERYKPPKGGQLMAADNNEGTGND